MEHNAASVLYSNWSNFQAPESLSCTSWPMNHEPWDPLPSTMILYCTHSPTNQLHLSLTLQRPLQSPALPHPVQSGWKQSGPRSRNRVTFSALDGRVSPMTIPSLASCSRLTATLLVLSINLHFSNSFASPSNSSQSFLRHHPAPRAPVAPAARQPSVATFSFTPNWSRTSPWAGAEWWATPLWGWRVQAGSLIAAAQTGASATLLPYEASQVDRQFTLQVTVRLVATGKKPPIKGKDARTLAAGLSFGRTAVINDYRAHAVYPRRSRTAGVHASGAVSLGPVRSQPGVLNAWRNARISLRCQKIGSKAVLRLEAVQGAKRVTLNWITGIGDVAGLVAIYTAGPSDIQYMPTPRFRTVFSRFKLTALRRSWHPERKYGPILWTQYVLSQKVLSLQAQLAPISGVTVYFQVYGGSKGWKTVQSKRVDTLTHTAKFVVRNWDASKYTSYRVRVLWQGAPHNWKGTVRAEPQRKLSIACFSCDFGYLFPQVGTTKRVGVQNPDMLYFAGDQIYEYFNRKAERFAPIRITMLEFFERFYLFGWTWRHLLKNRPAVIIPDDHDVFQGNLFGHRGRKLSVVNKKFDLDDGGYLMPGTFVNAVQKCNSGHLPPPARWARLKQGILPYFTSFVYGNVGFAVLEDRKFKTGPMSIAPSKRKRGTGGALLGSEQEAFLKNWARSWRAHRVKVAFSQTIFACVATHSGVDLSRNRYCLDSGAWPHDARNRAVRLLANARALSLHGDMHLGALVRQGVSKFNDAGYAFMVPGTANGFPRAWWPGVRRDEPKAWQRFTGRYYDDTGIPINVIAVGNPEYGSNDLSVFANNPAQVAFKRGSGYGLVEIDTATQKAKISLFRVGGANVMFDGFPKSIFLGGANWTSGKWIRLWSSRVLRGGYSVMITVTVLQKWT